MIKILIVLFLCCSQLWAQDLVNERIRKIDGKKKSVFIDKGIFHSAENKIQAKLLKVRHSFDAKTQIERIVFDFDSVSAPRLYGYISDKDNKIFLDFFNTSLGDGVSSLGVSKLVEKMDFYPIEKDMLSYEISFKHKIGVDIFYLDQPGRLVIDVKK